QQVQECLSAASHLWVAELAGGLLGGRAHRPPPMVPLSHRPRVPLRKPASACKVRLGSPLFVTATSAHDALPRSWRCPRSGVGVRPESIQAENVPVNSSVRVAA